MKITADIRVQPVKFTTSASKMVAGHKAAFEAAGVSALPHDMGLNVQGEAGTVLGVLREILATMHSDGLERAYTSITIESRADAPPSIQEKIKSIQAAG